MYNNDVYKNKYLKWKSKYLHLKGVSGGGQIELNIVIGGQQSIQTVINDVQKVISTPIGTKALARYKYVIKIHKNIIMKSFEDDTLGENKYHPHIDNIMKIIQNCLHWHTYLFSKVFRTSKKSNNPERSHDDVSDGVYVYLDMFPVTYLPTIIKFICLIVESIICWIVDILFTEQKQFWFENNSSAYNDLSTQLTELTNMTATNEPDSKPVTDLKLKRLIQLYVDDSIDTSTNNPTELIQYILDHMENNTYYTNKAEYYILNKSYVDLQTQYLNKNIDISKFLKNIIDFKSFAPQSDLNLPNLSKLAENTEKTENTYRLTKSTNYWVGRYVYIEIPKLLNQMYNMEPTKMKINLDKEYSAVNSYGDGPSLSDDLRETWVYNHYYASERYKVVQSSSKNHEIKPSIEAVYEKSSTEFTSDARAQVIKEIIDTREIGQVINKSAQTPKSVQAIKEIIDTPASAYNEEFPQQKKEFLEIKMDLETSLKNLFYYAVDIYFKRTFPLNPSVYYKCDIKVPADVFNNIKDNIKTADAFLHYIDKYDFLQVGSKIKYIYGGENIERTIKDKITFNDLESLIKAHHKELCLDFTKFKGKLIDNKSCNDDNPIVTCIDLLHKETDSLQKKNWNCKTLDDCIKYNNLSIGWLLGAHHPHCPDGNPGPGPPGSQKGRTHHNENNWDHSFTNYKILQSDQNNPRPMVTFEEPSFVVIFEQ